MSLKVCVQFVLGSITAFASSQSFAKPDSDWTNYGLRPLGMGNAFVSVVDDYNALFYNPAGLARLESWDGEFLNPTLTLSQNTAAFAADLQKLAEGSASDASGVIGVFEKQSGKTQSFSIGWDPHLIFPNFGMGIGIDLNARMVFHRYPSVDLDVGPSIILPIAFAMNFLENRLSVGAGIKFVAKGGILHEFSIQDLEAFTSKEGSGSTGPKLEDFVVGGYGMGADLGILFTPIKTMAPTLGISITDFGGTQYEKADISGKALGTPEARLPSVNVGFSFKPLMMERQYVLVAVDNHQINQPVSFSKRLNLGAEWGFGKQLLKVQAGLHQGYWTAGFQFDVGLLNVKLVSYGEELGKVAGSNEDRRYALQFKLVI